MAQFIAFLRAVNVVGRVVKMDALRGHFEAMGFSNVRTFIASGNVIFQTNARDPRAIERKIEKHLRAALGFEVATFVRAAAEVAAVACHEPFGPADLRADGHSLYIAVLRDQPTADAAGRLLGFRSAFDDFHVRGREVYWLCRGTLTESAFTGALLEKTMGMPATLRNVTTIRKLAANFCDDTSARPTRAQRRKVTAKRRAGEE